jgi:fibronectin-binding autotransporter adhesin
MKTTLPVACALLHSAFCTLHFLSPLPALADPYIWDNQNGNGIWNDPVNWGINNNPDYNVVPTAADSAIFRNTSPAGTVTLTNDGFATKIRQNVNAPVRTITIGSGQIVDRTLALSGTVAELFDCGAATANLTIDGTPNGNGARLKLQIDGSGTLDGTAINNGVSVVLNCAVSGAGGFILSAGQSGAGTLVLGGSNTYSGATTVNAGTLRVNGSLAAASVLTVNSGATLGGTGVIGGPVAVNTGGILSPGASVGALNLNSNLTLSGNLLIEVNKSLSPSNDVVNVAGALTNAGTGTLTVLNLGGALATGDSFKIFNKPVPNGQALHIVSSGSEIWTNKLTLDGSIAVLAAPNPPSGGDPTNVFVWLGTSTNQFTTNPADWVGGLAPPPLSSNIWLFQGDLKVPYNWPFLVANYGTTILIFSNNIVLNSIKVLGGSNTTVNFGSYVQQQTPMPCYFGIVGPVPISYGSTNYWVTNAFHTNALGDASVGGQTEFQCTGGRLDLYGVLKDGAGAHSRLVKSGNNTLNITGSDHNTYSGGTLVNAGPIKLAKPPGINAIPGDVTVNGSGSLVMNVVGGEQIADSAIVTFYDSASFNLAGQPETIQTVQSTSASTSIILGTGGTLTVAPSSSGTYNAGTGESDFYGSISGSGTVVKNGTGIYGMLGANSVANLTVDSGMVKINGNSGTGPVTVNTGSTLLAVGAIAGPVTFADGGTLGAGFSAGSLTLAAGLDLSASGNGSTNVWELADLKDNTTGAAGGDFDQIVLTGGTLALGPQSSLDIRFIGSATAPDATNLFWQSTHAWTVISIGGGSNPGPSNFGRIKNGSYSAGNFTTAPDVNGNIVLRFTPNASTSPPRAQITAIARTGPASVTVYYSNTLAGTNYTLFYNTNLSNTTIWYSLGSKTASGSSDSQTDTSATNSQRFYRVRSQ